MALFAVLCPPPWYKSPEWWLFILGIPTLIFIGVQAVASRKAAEAALLNARALVNSERAWIDVDFMPIRPAATQYHMLVVNHGRSPAFVTGLVLGRAYWTDGIGDIPVGFTGNVTPEKLSLYSIIPPNREPVHIMNFDVAQYSSGEDGRSVTYHGQIMYKDIFKQEHRTEIVYLLHPPSGMECLSIYTRYVTKTEKGEQAN